MLQAVGTYEVDKPILLRVLGVCASAGSVALWWALYQRREIVQRKAKNVAQAAIVENAGCAGSDPSG